MRTGVFFIKFYGVANLSTPAVRLTHDMLVANAAEWEVLSDLIGRIYEAALDPTGWDDTLALIVVTLGPPDWGTAMLMWEWPAPAGGRFVAAAGLGGIIRDLYLATYAGNNPWSRRFSNQPLGRVVDTFDIMPLSELTDHPIYTNFLKSWGMDRAIGVVLDRRGGERLGLIMPGTSDRDVRGLKRGLRLLAPHLQRAVRISRALGEANLRADAVTEALDRAPVAVVTLRRDLSVLNANIKAKALAEAGWIRLGPDRFGFHDHRAQDRLGLLAATAPPTTAAFSILGPDGSDLAVLGARLIERTVETLAGPMKGAAVVLTIGVTDPAPLLQIDRLGAWFGLTPSEARLAGALASGTTLGDYAARRHVSMNAVRFLLKGVYRKTGVVAQSQLVATLRSLPAD